jgi:hypothetical protein
MVFFVLGTNTTIKKLKVLVPFNFHLTTILHGTFPLNTRSDDIDFLKLKTRNKHMEQG